MYVLKSSKFSENFKIHKFAHIGNGIWHHIYSKKHIFFQKVHKIFKRSKFFKKFKNFQEVQIFKNVSAWKMFAFSAFFCKKGGITVGIKNLLDENFLGSLKKKPHVFDENNLFFVM